MKIVVEVAAVSLALGALVRGDVTPLKNPCLDAAHAAEPGRTVTRTRSSEEKSTTLPSSYASCTLMTA